MKNIKKYLILLFVFIMFIEFGYSNQKKFDKTEIKRKKIEILRKRIPGQSDENYKKYKIIDLKPEKIYLLSAPGSFEYSVGVEFATWFPNDNDNILIVYLDSNPIIYKDRKIIYIYNFGKKQFELINEEINKDNIFGILPFAVLNKKIILFGKRTFGSDKKEIISYDIISKERKQIGTFEGGDFPFPKDGKIEKFRSVLFAEDDNNFFTSGTIDDKGHRGIMRFKKRIEESGGKKKSIFYEREITLDFGCGPILLPDGKSIFFKYEDENSNMNFCLYNFEKKGDIKRLDINRIPEKPYLKIGGIVSISPDRKKILCITEYDPYKSELVVVEFNKELCGR